MKKVVLASLLAVAGAAFVAQPSFSQTPVNLGTAAQQPAATTAAAPGNPCAVPAASGPAPVSLGTGAAGGQVTMSADEYASYNNAITQTTPAAKAAAFDAYLKAYPKSSVKSDALQQEMFAYSQVPDTQKTLDTADALLAVDPCNLYAYVFEVSLRSAAAASATDPAAKQAGLDAAAGFAVKGLAATKPAAMSDADFTKLKGQGYPIFYSAIGAADLNKKDQAGAIKAFSSELASVPVAQTTAPGPQLMDTYYLASAYYTQTPPDYLSCAYYSARAAFYAPEPFKTTFTKLGTYCYTKYHGRPDGYDVVTAAAKDNLTMPAACPVAPAGSTGPAPAAPAGCLAVTPAPKPADIVANLIATTPDLATLALSDKEYVLQNAAPVDQAKCTADPTKCKSDADKVFDTIKGKSVEIPGAIVVSATADTLTVAVSDDSQQAQPPVADFTFTMAKPLTKVPAVGDKITLDGTYASYTQSPLMITMSDGAVVEPKKAPVKAPVRHTTTHH